MQNLVTLIFITILTTIALVAILFVNNFGVGFSNKISDWSNTATLFSGTLTPILSFCSLLLILHTLRQNHDALQNSKNSIDLSAAQLNRSEIQATLSNFESSFYSYMKFLTELVNNLSISRTQNSDYLHDFNFDHSLFNEFKGEFFVDNLENINFEKAKGNEVFKSIVNTIECVHYCFNGRGNLGDITKLVLEMDGSFTRNYLKLLCSILNFVDQADGIEFKDIYFNIIKAQINEYGKSFIFLVLLANDPSFRDLKELVVKYSLLEDISCIIDETGLDGITPLQINIEEALLSNYVSVNNNCFISAFGAETLLGKLSVEAYKNEN
ncbi:putative phage abortive infection protein [Pseudoalteromonas sp. TAB23]|uniref:putative phage abortive infection protein n=1 Tax=Pseudoalteromonas sp. TAB23 TaxID=1938595 RepID=UPI000421658F|nr:putative phage abortive infection protein [Pseudoalteromonas sp. TAB23]